MENENLKEAIKELTGLGSQLVAPHVEHIPFHTERGERSTFPVVFLADGHGKVRAEPLINMVRAASTEEERKRLAIAIGPDRRKGTANHQTLASFIAHMLRFKDDDSAVWADADTDIGKAALVGIFNYHQTGAENPARWGDHRAKYDCPISDAWESWGGGSPVALSQEEFAEFLESRDFDLASGTLTSGTTAPSPAHLITMANRLEVYSTATAKRERDPNTHRVRISYSEDKGVSGDLVPPAAFLICIPVFTDSEPEMMEVRLRVNIEGGRAKFTVQVHNAKAIWRKSFEKVCQEVIARTGLPVYQGTPEE